MICPECNISGGCDCHVTKRVKHKPIDHVKEQDKYLDDLHSEAIQEIEKKRKEKLKQQS